MPSEDSLKLAQTCFDNVEPQGKSGRWFGDCVDDQIANVAAEFELLLPEGAVAVNREQLRVALEAKFSSCLWDNCAFDALDDERPHSPDCPAGGDDA